MIKQLENFQGLNTTFHLSNQCNMRCKYCYELNKFSDSLKIEEAQKFIDLILTDKDPCNLLGTDSEWIMNHGLILDMIGGDPFAEVDLMEEIIQYFIFKSISLKHRWSQNYRISISTNGTYFGQQKVRTFMEKYRPILSVGVSIDGNHAMHDMNRIMPDGSGSLDIILKDWEWYCDWLGMSPGTKATWSKDSIPHIYDSIKFMYEEMGIKYINANFIFEDMKLGEKDLLELENQFKKLIEYILDHKNDIYVSLFDSRWLNAGKMIDPERSWCGSGSMPALDTDGRIYPCFRFVPQNMGNPEWNMSVGDTTNGFNHKENFTKISRLSRDTISPDKCKECEIESACAYCVAGAFAETGVLHRQTYICEIHKLQAKYAKEYWKKYEELTGTNAPSSCSSCRI